MMMLTKTTLCSQLDVCHTVNLKCKSR